MSRSQFQQELERILAGIHRYQPQKVILFGSFAREDYHALSDVDLLIIKETGRPFTERIGDVLALCDYSILACFLSQQAAEKALKAYLLDQYYIPTRYPNGLPGGIPYKVYTWEQAQEAIVGAQRVLDQVGCLLPSNKETTL